MALLWSEVVERFSPQRRSSDNSHAVNPRNGVQCSSSYTVSCARHGTILSLLLKRGFCPYVFWEAMSATFFLKTWGRSGVYAGHSHGCARCKSVVCTPRLAVSGCVHRFRTEAVLTTHGCPTIAHGFARRQHAETRTAGCDQALSGEYRFRTESNGSGSTQTRRGTLSACKTSANLHALDPSPRLEKRGGRGLKMYRDKEHVRRVVTPALRANIMIRCLPVVAVRMISTLDVRNEICGL
ncbi:hypothetical protein Bbelb_360140 [Branchiostoma belcheri]|nr:hypothetical protein Bbelb_360140 [Branchiostoma belcheri]